MILDAENLFSNVQAITSTTLSTNVINLSSLRDIGVGENLYVHLNVDVALADVSGTDSTITVALQMDDADTFGSGTTIQTLFTVPATAAAGTRLIARIQPLSPLTTAPEQYLALLYTVNNGNLSAGSVTAGIIIDAEIQKYYASGFQVLK